MDFGETRPSTEDTQQVSQLSAERLRNWQTLQLEAHGDFGVALDGLNSAMGTAMQPRLDGYHLTLVSPPESGKLATLTQEQVGRLQQVNEEIQKGEGITVEGVGYIDGATTTGIREADKGKKTAFVAVDIPSLTSLRKELGLPDKDFHITLGFDGGDIHMQVVGKNEKGKDVLVPIPKKANPELAQYVPQNIRFGSISGQQRQPANK